MTLQIPLSPEVEAKLHERAAAAGKDPVSFVLQVVEEELAADETLPASDRDVRLSAQQRISELRAWAAGHAKLPHEADDSRESIYEGRGE